MRGAAGLDGTRQEVAHARLRVELRKQRALVVQHGGGHGGSPA